MRRSKDLSFELIKVEEIEKSVEEIVKSARATGMPGILRNRNFLKKALSNRESAVTIVAKKKGKLVGAVNGISIKNQPLIPKITFVWVKDRKSAREGIPQTLINKFVEEAKKRTPRAPSIEVNLPTFDANSISFYCMSGFFIEGFIKGTRESPDMIVMRRLFDKDSSMTPVA